MTQRELPQAPPSTHPSSSDAASSTEPANVRPSLVGDPLSPHARVRRAFWTQSRSAMIALRYGRHTLAISWLPPAA